MWFQRRDRSSEESHKALRDAKKNLDRIENRGDEVSELAEAFKEFRARNHFAEQLEEIIGRHRRSTS